MRRGILAGTLALVLLAGTVSSAAAEAPGGFGKPPRLTIRTTEGGVPRILADTFYGAGWGYGFSLAKQNICAMAQIYTTVRGERSRYFGPQETWTFTGNGRTFTNLDGDFFFKRVVRERTVERLLELKPPNGPRPEVRSAVKGYVRGYNFYLRRTGVANLPDESCRGEPWVKEITLLDAYRRFFMLGILGSQGTSINGIVNAQPPGTPLARRNRRAAAQTSPAAGVAALAASRPDIGSNAVALGRNATETRKGMLLGNPHFPWVGSERFFQSQITIPGKMNASGASLLGVPVILIGHTRNLAWSHTVSTAFRFVPFRETLVPGAPLYYYVDGQPRRMKPTTVTVQVRQEDGSIAPVSRTLWRTIHGPITTSLQGQSLFPWTNEFAYAMHDSVANNFRFLNHFFNASRSQSVGKMLQVLRKTQGVPWVNTIAADSKGNALYADISIVPNVSDEMVTECNTPGIGELAHASLGLPVLDGSRSACQLPDEAGSTGTDNMPAAEMPFTVRADYAMNANDSYWVPHATVRLEGFDRIIGAEGTVRSPRTRLGLVMIEERLAGPGRFSLGEVQDLITNNRGLLGELWRDELVAMCQANPTLEGSSGPVDVSQACQVLAQWDLRWDVDSRGALLFRRFANRAGTAPAVFDVPFDPNDVVNTPRGLNTDNPAVRSALADAVTDLQNANIPLDARWGDVQYEERGEERIPIHGGSGGLGIFNVITTAWNSGEGLGEPTHGSSFIQAASITGAKCPPVKTILTYSQAAENESSPNFADQTRRWSQERWYNDRFCRGQQLRSPGLRIRRFSGGALAEDKGF